MMGDLLGDIEGFTSVGMFPVAAESFAQNWVVGFLQSLGLFVKARQVPFDDFFHALEGLFLFDSSVMDDMVKLFRLCEQPRQHF